MAEPSSDDQPEDRGEAHKRAAALAALEMVEPGMRLGLGTGSTADHFTRALGARMRDGLRLRAAVATSERTAQLAAAQGIAVMTLDDEPELDLTVDGADEIDHGLRLIKGGGGALLREKIVASASRRMLVIADGSKLVAALGAFPLPIEVVPFGLGATRRAIASAAARLGLGGPLALRSAADGRPFHTDSGHLIVDAAFGRIVDPEALAAALDRIPGVVEHGLFLGLASEAIIAGSEGIARLSAPASAPVGRQS